VFDWLVETRGFIHDLNLLEQGEPVLWSEGPHIDLHLTPERFTAARRYWTARGLPPDLFLGDDDPRLAAEATAVRDASEDHDDPRGARIIAARRRRFAAACGRLLAAAAIREFESDWEYPYQEDEQRLVRALGEAARRTMLDALERAAQPAPRRRRARP
jgi:hypothetical protein